MRIGQGKRMYEIGIVVRILYVVRFYESHAMNEKQLVEHVILSLYKLWVH